jgi:hypothetical protein
MRFTDFGKIRAVRLESLRRMDKKKLRSLFITTDTLGKKGEFSEEAAEKSPGLPPPFLPNLRRKLKAESISQFATILRLLLLQARSGYAQGG